MNIILHWFDGYKVSFKREGSLACGRDWTPDNYYIMIKEDTTRDWEAIKRMKKGVTEKNKGKRKLRIKR